MKLRNKKTGDIVEVLTDSIAVNVLIDREDITGYYTSLAELNEEWEDYEEPKEYWFITWCGDVDMETDDGMDTDKDCKEIGNYFNTREEAEKAVEKLKAWKLLKDECKIKFDGIIRDEKAGLKAVNLSYDRHPVTLDRMRECMDALHLLFGDEK